MSFYVVTMSNGISSTKIEKTDEKSAFDNLLAWLDENMSPMVATVTINYKKTSGSSPEKLEKNINRKNSRKIAKRELKKVKAAMLGS